MKKYYFPHVITFVLFFFNESHSQVTTGNGSKDKVKWERNPFNHQVFIANKGQFDGSIPGNEPILYGAQLGKVWAYFTASGVKYSYTEIQRSARGREPDEERPVKTVIHRLSSNWVGANPSTIIETGDEQSYYYTYPKGTNGSIKTNIYKKITYRNIYPGIDIEYVFPKGKEGLKYSIIAHPGADISAVKLNYKGAGELKLNASNDVTFSSELGNFTEHAPISFYGGESENTGVSYKVNGSIESFCVNENNDKSKTLVIDPWITDPLFSDTDRAYDLDWDKYGNVYAYGGNPTSLLQLTKMDNTGAIKWTFNATSISDSGNYYGDFCTDKSSGACYLVQGFAELGAHILKINAGGTLISSYTGSSSMDEFWRVEFDENNHKIVIAGGGVLANQQAGVIDTNLINLHYYNVLGAVAPYHDMCLLAMDPNGTQCYMASARKIMPDTQQFNNVFMQLPLPSLTPAAYLAHDNLGFVEDSSVRYYDVSPYLGFGNGMNGAAASLNWLYLYNGNTLKRFNKNTGAFVSKCTLRPTNIEGYSGGLDVDQCDNLLVGVADTIYVLNSAFTIINKIPLPDTVYDIHIGQGSALYACGKGYVTQLTNPLPNSVTATCTPSSCSMCSGSASVNVNCSSGPFSYSWSNGATTQTISGFCAGTYTITVTDNSFHPAHIDTATIVITQPGTMNLVADSINDNGGCNGSAWAIVSGGVPPYTYLWTAGQTTDTIKNQCHGSYCCKVTDANGCIDSVCVTIELSTGIGNTYSNSNQINVYPNPNSGKFIVNLENLTGAPQIRIYNVLGQQIYQSELTSLDTQINLGTKATGIYFYRIIAENGNLISDGKMVVE